MIRNTVICVVASIVSFLLLEAATRVGLKLGWIDVDANPISGFWADLDPDFGVWHRSNATYVHERSCFKVVYRSNSFGALDKERSLPSAGSRVVALGDSMIEGYTLDTDRRLTDRLERASGIEVLNFATSQIFGPVQYLLVYEKLASRFAHDAVVVGFLPYNDFTDSDWSIGRQAFYNRYRPYLRDVGGSYNLEYFNSAYFEPQDRQGEGQRKLLDRSVAVRAIKRSYAIWQYRTVVNNEVVQSADPLTPKIRSYYYDYSEEDLRLAAHILRRIVAAADGRPVLVFTIPMRHDLENVRSRGAPPLPRWFEAQAKQSGFSYIDLLEVFAKHEASWDKFYHTCDNHWTAEANELAAATILPQIEMLLRKAGP
ncbi:MAG: hypothetical protein U1E23_10610 [Reyranellaceae bacterium]